MLLRFIGRSVDGNPHFTKESVSLTLQPKSQPFRMPTRDRPGSRERGLSVDPRREGHSRSLDGVAHRLLLDQSSIIPFDPVEKIGVVADAEAMLVLHVAVLNTLFANMLSRAHQSQYVENMERFLALGSRRNRNAAQPARRWRS
jgi:hypothetical protein